MHFPLLLNQGTQTYSYTVRLVAANQDKEVWEVARKGHIWVLFNQQQASTSCPLTVYWALLHGSLPNSFAFARICLSIQERYNINRSSIARYSQLSPFVYPKPSWSKGQATVE